MLNNLDDFRLILVLNPKTMTLKIMQFKKVGKQILPTLWRWKLTFLLAMTNGLFAQNSYTFTNCGATGSVGPTQTAANTAYTLTNLNGSVTVTGGIQTFTIPNSGPYRITALGAKGYGTNGGRGANIAGDFTLTAGTVLKILVGQQGAPPVSPGTNQYGGGGGSFVTYTNNTPLVVAGGGGGSWAATLTTLSDGTTTTNGNAGTNGPTNGVGGTGGGGGGTAGSADGGGGLTGNGAGTTGGLAFVNGGTGGSQYGHGGFGGGGGGSSWDNRRGCGGGGYSGGGGAGSTTTGFPEGGGGGSFNAGANPTNVAGSNTGHGLVIITELCNVRITASGSNSLAPSICAGNSVTLTTNAIGNYNWSTGNTTNASIVVSPTVTTTYTVAGTGTVNSCQGSSAITVTVSSGLPVLSVSGSTNICLGKTATITATGALTYTITNGISNGVSFSPSVTSNYIVSGQNGCGTSTALATVTVAPLSVSAVSQPTTNCAGYASTLVAVSAVNGYTWTPSNNTNANAIVNPTATTIYTVTASDGTCAGTATVQLNINPIPTISIVGTNSTVCPGGAVTLTASGGISYSWTPVNQTNTVITVNPTGPTLYNVTGLNSFGCASSANFVVVTVPGPTLNVSASSNLICGGESATITAGGATTYTWSNSANTNSIAVTPASTSIYTITGTTNNCDATQTVQISVLNASVAVSGPTAICSGATATLTASGADTYTWSNGFQTSSIPVTPSGSTSYTVSAITSSGNINCPSSTVFQVNVNPNPTVSAVPTRSFMCAKENNTLTASGANTYSWSTSATTPTISITSTVVTTLLYTVTGIDANGCSNSFQFQVKVNGCSGLNENTNTAGLSVYPNPNNGQFVIETEADEVLRVTNELGQVVLMLHLDADNNRKVSVENLPSGIYFISGERIHTKVIVQK